MRRVYSESVEVQVVKFRPLVVRIARQIRAKLPAGFSLDDLVQDGMLGLLDAINKYKPRSGVPFEHYASFRIRGAIYDGCRSSDVLTRASREKEGRVYGAEAQLAQTLGREPQSSEIANHLKISLEEYQTIVESFAFFLTIDDPRIQAIADDSHEEAVGNSEFDSLKRQIVSHLRTLPERTQQILALHYDQGLSYRDIAEIFDITAGRVSQLHSEAIAVIRDGLKL